MKEIYVLAHKSDLSQREIAELYPIHRGSYVSKIKNQQRWGHVTEEVDLDEEEPVLV